MIIDHRYIHYKILQWLILFNEIITLGLFICWLLRHSMVKYFMLLSRTLCIPYCLTKGNPHASVFLEVQYSNHLMLYGNSSPFCLELNENLMETFTYTLELILSIFFYDKWDCWFHLHPRHRTYIYSTSGRGPLCLGYIYCCHKKISMPSMIQDILYMGFLSH